jgi:uncharacterized membrane protein YczE
MLSGAFALNWHGWRRFALDFAIIQMGFCLFGIAINIMVQAGLGTSPWVVLQVALTRHLPVTLGQASMAVGTVVILLDILLREPLGWGSLANVLFVGLWVDWLSRVIPPPPPNLWLQVPYLLLGCLIMGLATAVYAGIQAGTGPRDSLMLAVARLARLSVRRARTFIDTGVLLLGWLMGGAVGFGTVIIALSLGPSIQFWFRLLRVPSVRQASFTASSSSD